MRKKWMLSLMSLVLLFSLTACWNSKELQSMAYVTSIGFDYDKGKYITYIQVLNFANVAKSESLQIGTPTPAWIGKGTGVTVTESFNRIDTTSQMRLYWGHVKSIVVSERFLKNRKKIQEAYDLVNRFGDIRYNIYIYATKEPLKGIFSQKSILELPPLDTVLGNPMETYTQNSMIYPHYGYKMVAHLNEPTGIAAIPSLSIERKSWTEDEGRKSVLKINGAYFFNGNKFKGWLSEQDLAGDRWFHKKFNQSSINVPDNGNPVAAVVLTHPKSKIRYVLREGKVYFNISLSIQAYVDELVQNVSKKEIEEKAAQVIESQIRETYNKGRLINADVLDLGEHLYRTNPAKWKEMQNNGESMLGAESLDRVDVKVRVKHTGKFKLRVK